MKRAYFDCLSGISGDMCLGALLDLGLPRDALEARLGTLPLKGYHIDVRREKRMGIAARRFVVLLDKEQKAARGLNEVVEIIEKGDFSGAVKEKSVEVFHHLAGAEGAVHGVPPEEVHFHELGAVDSIIDIVGTVYGIEALGISDIFVSKIPLGSGFTKSSHGLLPVPAPATLKLLAGVPVFDSGLSGELVTPTGAALVKAYAQSFGHLPPMELEGTGYGAGEKELPDRPNVLRILLGEEALQGDQEMVVLLETNLDDAQPECLGYLMERLFESGALDVVFCPVQMKKNRPGVQVQVMAGPGDTDPLMEILFRESSALGVRFGYTQRKVLKRASLEVDSPWGRIKVKKVVQQDGSSLFLPEYEECKKIALESGLPLREIFSWVASLNQG